ncbi:DUF6714 family protein [Vibrio parahaemolyticus]|uniref:DUF6714 family protein n=1 Tax=Vibrio parahaemolyticus TaxID=670 RepID=UPI0011203E8B|nr:DUF6714 family protein [Vibrio parahaemolyticus]EJG2230338.1 hypothetical protein [Vibrio parahaemolyticus]ELJ9746543.1 hypothetical protein [Vibrio parahaemolyticus]TOI38799.1 hypothetical protein CGI60_23945 [Vibrio parahaemolyticus]HCG9703278.1 hypothetical protein [Vibrio parahaemolyticus]HCH5095940.1 hypothetical protein [Vibrio parahaemolyticus]
MDTEELIQKIIAEFPEVQVMNNPVEYRSWRDIPDTWIEASDILTFSKYAEDAMFFMPAYMCWALRNEPEGNGLVIDNIVHDLAEFGKCQSSGLAWLNFKFKCNSRQKYAVLLFLRYLRDHSGYVVDCVLINRAIKNWSVT